MWYAVISPCYSYILRLLSMAVDKGLPYTIKPDDRVAAFTAVISNSDIGLDTAFAYVTENFQNLQSKYGNSTYYYTIL